MKYLYYKLYQNLKTVKTNDTPATNALVILSMIHCANIATVQILFNHFFNIKLKFGSKNEIVLFAVILSISIMILNYFLLYKKREEICGKYKDEDKIQSKIGYAVLVLYIIGSASLLYFVGSRYPL